MKKKSERQGRKVKASPEAKPIAPRLTEEFPTSTDVTFIMRDGREITLPGTLANIMLVSD